jgi:hypothetical protein
MGASHEVIFFSGEFSIAYVQLEPDSAISLSLVTSTL